MKSLSLSPYEPLSNLKIIIVKFINSNSSWAALLLNGRTKPKRKIRIAFLTRRLLVLTLGQILVRLIAANLFIRCLPQIMTKNRKTVRKEPSSRQVASTKWVWNLSSAANSKNRIACEVYKLKNKRLNVKRERKIKIAIRAANSLFRLEISAKATVSSFFLRRIPL